MVPYGCIIMGVHGLSAGKATLIVLIFLIGAELAGEALPGLFEFGAGFRGDWFPGESKQRDETPPPMKW
jgi:hypothetical protein